MAIAAPEQARLDAAEARFDSSAFKAELVSLIPQLRAFTRFLCQSDAALADDVAQETLARAWSARTSYTPGTAMRAWLFVIARNLFYSTKRRARFVGVYDEEHAERILRHEGDQSVPLELDEVRRAMTLLPDDQREALILVTAGGLSYEEASVICDCAVGTIKSRVNRARAALQGIMDMRKGIPAPDAPAGQSLDTLIADARRLVDGK